MIQSLQTLPGTSVIYREWPAKKTSAIAVLLHGMGGHSGRWDKLCRAASHKGISCFALDLRGYGASQSPPGYVSSIHDFHRDISLLIAANRPLSAIPVYLIGESIGGLIALDYARLFPKRIAGIVALSPALTTTLPFSQFS